MANPSDPIITSFGWIEMGYDSLEEAFVAHDGTTHRAAAMRQFADEVGCSFAEVSSRVMYVRSLTYQEAWDDFGGRDWRDNWMGVNKVGFYFATHDYRYDSLGADLPAEQLRKATPPTIPAEPPADWNPSRYQCHWRVVKNLDASYPTPVHRVWHLVAR